VREEALGVDLADLPLAEAQAIDPRVTAAALAALTIDASVASRTSYGGTAPVRVREEIARWTARLDGQDRT
jgi:argininosuccinate lyase